MLCPFAMKMVYDTIENFKQDYAGNIASFNLNHLNTKQQYMFLKIVGYFEDNIIIFLVQNRDSYRANGIFLLLLFILSQQRNNLFFECYEILKDDLCSINSLGILLHFGYSDIINTDNEQVINYISHLITSWNYIIFKLLIDIGNLEILEEKKHLIPPNTVFYLDFNINVLNWLKKNNFKIGFSNLHVYKNKKYLKWFLDNGYEDCLEDDEFTISLFNGKKCIYTILSRIGWKERYEQIIMKNNIQVDRKSLYKNRYFGMSKTFIDYLCIIPNI